MQLIVALTCIYGKKTYSWFWNYLFRFIHLFSVSRYLLTRNLAPPSCRGKVLCPRPDSELLWSWRWPWPSFWSGLLHPMSTRITGGHHHACSLVCLGLNPGHCACQESSLPLGPLLQRLEFPSLFFFLLLELCSINFANILWYDYWVFVNSEESFSIFLLCIILFPTVLFYYNLGCFSVTLKL